MDSALIFWYRESPLYCVVQCVSQENIAINSRNLKLFRNTYGKRKLNVFLLRFGFILVQYGTYDTVSNVNDITNIFVELLCFRQKFMRLFRTVFTN